MAAATSMWKPPARRAYQPKPLDPGMVVEWERRENGESVTRRGTVWSAGPAPSSLWVIPDDAPGHAAAVKLPGKRGRDWGRGLSEMPNYPPGWARDAVRRAENVRQHGALYATVEQVAETWSWSYGRTTTLKTLCWHADPACPDAAGKEREDREPAWPVREVIAILLGQKHPAVSPRFCGRCVYLTAQSGPSAAA